VQKVMNLFGLDIGHLKIVTFAPALSARGSEVATPVICLGKISSSQLKVISKWRAVGDACRLHSRCNGSTVIRWIALGVEGWGGDTFSP
jgi:hypothetical protein